MSVVIKVLFVVLIVSTAAMVAVGIAIFLRVRRHLDGAGPEPEATAAAAKVSGQDDETAHIAAASEEQNHGGDRDT